MKRQLYVHLLSINCVRALMSANCVHALFERYLRARPWGQGQSEQARSCALGPQGSPSSYTVWGSNLSNTIPWDVTLALLGFSSPSLCFLPCEMEIIQY